MCWCFIHQCLFSFICDGHFCFELQLCVACLTESYEAISDSFIESVEAEQNYAIKFQSNLQANNKHILLIYLHIYKLHTSYTLALNYEPINNDEHDYLLIIYNKPTRCNSGSIVFIDNYKYALHILDALCFHHQEHYKL